MTPDVEKVAVRAFAAAIMAYLDWPEQESWTIAAALVRKAAEAAERQALRQRVFSPRVSTLSPAEQATISASYRAALAEAEKAKDSDELARLMSRYHDAGDRIGVLAAGQIAVERNAGAAMNLFRELQPLRAAALDELAEFEARWGHHRDATGRFNETIATSPIPRPAGSGNMDMSA